MDKEMGTVYPVCTMDTCSKLCEFSEFTPLKSKSTRTVKQHRSVMSLKCEVNLIFWSRSQIFLSFFLKLECFYQVRAFGH